MSSLVTCKWAATGCWHPLSCVLPLVSGRRLWDTGCWNRWDFSWFCWALLIILDYRWQCKSSHVYTLTASSSSCSLDLKRKRGMGAGQKESGVTRVFLPNPGEEAEVVVFMPSGKESSIVLGQPWLLSHAMKNRHACFHLMLNNQNTLAKSI